MRGEQYLTKTEQYALVYSQGNSWASDLFVVKALANGLALSRYGFSVSKRIGKAVTRNRVKRLFREIMRAIPLQPGWDIIVIARPKAAGADYALLKRVMVGLLSRGRLLGMAEEGSFLSGVQAGGSELTE